MTLDEPLLARLADWQPAGPGPHGFRSGLARRVTGLLEPLRLIEVDAARAEALLRSEKPAARGDELYYYELLLRGEHSSTLRRYKATRTGSRRETVPYALTHEAIAKLATDLAGDE